MNKIFKFIEIRTVSIIRALRFIYQDYGASYENLLIKAKMPTQHIRRIRTMALETYKILNGLAPPVLTNLVKKQDHTYKFRYTNLLQFGSNFNEFKNHISFWNGKSCTCIVCQNS
jgi:hypothetical protein